MKGSYPRFWTIRRRAIPLASCSRMPRQMLERVIAEKWLTARAVYGLFPANAVNGDDIAVSQMRPGA